MFIGHFAIGFASKRFAPAAPLGLLLAAPLAMDIALPIFVVLGLEHLRIEPGATVVMPIDSDMPYSHSLASGIASAALFAGIYFALRRDARAAVVLAIAVLSHWLLDWLTHRPDMALYPGGPRLGLGLWNSLAGTIAVEGALSIACIAFYAKGTRARDRAGTIGLWSLVGTLVLLYFATLFSPPPPNASALLFGLFVLWIFFPWAMWLDRHRENAS